MKFIRCQRTELKTLWLIVDVDVGVADWSGYFWGGLWIVVKVQKCKKIEKKYFFLVIVWNFVGITEASNVKKIFKNFQEIQVSKSQKAADCSAVEF